MKVLVINGSPHLHGTTGTAIDLVTAELAAQGIESEVLPVGHQLLHGCTGCDLCGQERPRRCAAFPDDVVNVAIAKMAECDGLLLASPVYYGGLAGTMKCFLDRFFYAGADVRFKAAAALVCLRRSGGSDALHQLNNYLHLAQAVLPPTQYWAVVHGNGSGEELKQDAEGVQILRTLGKNMAWLMHSLQSGAVPQPEREKRARTNFIR